MLLVQINWNLDVELLLKNCLSNFANNSLWTIDRTLASINGKKKFFWLVVRPPQYKIKKEGWKLHISSNLQTLEEILQQVLPILYEHVTCFKVVESVSFLADLNNNPYDRIQTGKAITIYPDNEEHAEIILPLLAQATQHLIGPTIVTDIQYCENSIVYYRWGSFTPNHLQTIWGAILPQIQHPDGSKNFDKRNFKSKFVGQDIDPFLKDRHIKPNKMHILAGQYWKSLHIYSGSSTEVYLGLDLKNKKKCIIKIALKNSLFDVQGNDAKSRLKREPFFLNKLKNLIRVPLVYDELTDEQQNYNLILEDLGSEDLADIFDQQINKCQFMANEQLFNLIYDLINSFSLMHQEKIVHADLKFENIILCEGKYGIIDFNSASQLDRYDFAYTCGSVGFSNLNRLEGGEPKYQDDIYSFGAILYYFATNTDPAFNPLYPKDEIIKPSLFNSNLDSFIENIILLCLQQKIDNFMQLKIIFETRNKINIALSYTEKRNFDFQAKCMYLAKTYLNSFYKEYDKHLGLVSYDNNGLVLDDLRGIAGSIIALANINIFYPDKYIQKVLRKSRNYIEIDEALDYNRIPGLYVGESGRALACLYLGIALQENKIINKAKLKLINTNSMPYIGIDLFHGLSGRLKTNCLFYLLTKDKIFLSAAEDMFLYLRKHSIELDDLIYWPNATKESTEDFYEYDYEDIFLGLAHGIAGVVDAFIDYYDCTHSHDVASLIKNTLTKLKNKFIYLNNEAAIIVPIRLNSKQCVPFWCNGNLGIAKVYLRAYQRGLISNGLEIAEKMAASLIETASGNLPIQCHGIASVIDYLVDLFIETKNNRYLDMIYHFEKILSSWVNKFLDSQFDSKNVHLELLSYSNGIPGILSTYLKLSEFSQGTIFDAEYINFLNKMNYYSISKRD